MNPQSIQRLNTSLNRARVAPPPKLKSQQICTVGAPEAYRVNYETVCAVPVPETEYHPRSGNASYQPVPYASLINGARDAMANVLDADPVFETYALNQKGSQLFGMIGFGSGLTGQAITVALRSSYDKSISNRLQSAVHHSYVPTVVSPASTWSVQSTQRTYSPRSVTCSMKSPTQQSPPSSNVFA